MRLENHHICIATVVLVATPLQNVAVLGLNSPQLLVFAYEEVYCMPKPFVVVPQNAEGIALAQKNFS